MATAEAGISASDFLPDCLVALMTGYNFADDSFMFFNK